MKTDFLQEDLLELEHAGLRRKLRRVDSPQGPSIILDGRRVLNFACNDYLGLANDPRIRQTAISSIEAEGFGAGASRLICGNMGAHEALEADLASFKNTESALVYSSGYMANTGIISALLNRNSVVLSDRLNHASILDGIILSRAQLLRYPHADMQALEGMLKDLPGTQRRLVVTDSVFSMDGDKAPLKEIVDLARRYDALVMVDEAHAFGVLGEKGSGLVEELGLGASVDVQMGTLSKAAGSFGAYACGTKLLCEYLINRSRSFIYTTAMPPAIAQASRTALQIIREGGALRQRLRGYADYMRRELDALGFDTMRSSTPIIPILVKDPAQALAMSQRLLQKGFFVQAIRPPTVPLGTSRLRLTLMATHTQEDLNQLADALRTL